MALPLLMLVGTAKNALDHWQTLPPDERERLRGTAAAVRGLAAELAGPKAGTLLGGHAAGMGATSSQRSRDVVARELRDALAVLAAAATSTGAAAVGGRTRRGAAVGKVVGFGARKVGERMNQRPAVQGEQVTAAPGPAPFIDTADPARLMAAAVSGGAGGAVAAPLTPVPVAEPAQPPVTWATVSAAMESVWGGERTSPTMLVFDVELDEGARRQRMFATLEVVDPDFEFLHVQTAIGFLDEIDLAAAVRHAGGLVNGSLGHVAAPDGPGILTFAIKLPMAVLDHDELDTVLLTVQLLGRTADRLEQELAAPGTPDRF